MKYDVLNDLPESVLEKIRRHSLGAENLKSKNVGCHFCEHKTIEVYEDSRGYIKAKCKRCRAEAIYNIALRRNLSAFSGNG
jgi:phage FluMu protein Com